MAKYLQLYLDTDFIIPIGVGESGNFQKYIDDQSQRRLWLYFSKRSNMYESDAAYKANFEAGIEGYLGDFWKHIESKDLVPGESYPYIELLDLSRIISKLREWSNAALGTETPEFVLNFSTVIPVKARRAFADYLSQKIGNIRSYSVEINDLLSAKVAYDHQTMSPVFGDQLLIIQSVGRDILLSVQTWCGDQFMQGDEPVRLEKQGKDFLKHALAKIVVDHYEQNYHMLLPEQKEREYLYQMQFADEWLNARAGGDTFWVDKFHYSVNPAKIYEPVEIDCKQLDLIEANAISTTIEGISRYYRENIVNRHLHTILSGDVFKEDVFLNKCVSVTSSDGKYTFFNDNAVQEAMGRYRVKYATLTEDPVGLERIFLDKANERERIRSYVHNAETLGYLRDSLNASIAKIRGAIEAVAYRNADLKASWESAMKRSAFSKAAEMVNQMSTGDELMTGKAESIEVLKKIEARNSLLVELMQLKEVAPIVDGLRSSERELRQLISDADNLNTLPETLSKTTLRYRDSYERYLELKRQFDAESTLAVRMRLVDEMQQLTMEEMPVLDVAPVTGRIMVESKTTGGFLGFGAKRSISIKLSIDHPLPCRGVLIVSPSTLSSIPSGRAGVYSMDVDKGAEGVVIETITDVATLGLEKNAKTLYIKFWPHEEEKIPINRFEIEGGGMKTI